MDMQEKLVTELILEGLNCTQCGAKIEKHILALPGVTAVSVNMINKTLSFETEDLENSGELTNLVRGIVKRIEPDVVVKEKVISQIPQKVLILMGLDCAHCAGKIEGEIKKIPGVKNASLDFLSKKLRLEVKDHRDFASIIPQVDQLVSKFEPGVNIVEEENVLKNKEEEQEENKKELWRLGIGAAFFAVAFYPFDNGTLKFALFLISYLIIGGEVLIRAGRNILRGQIFDENFLMAIATIGAFAIRQYPEGVAVMLFYQIGEFFQDTAVNHSRRSIKSLLDIKPDYANLICDGQEKRVAPEEVMVGDIIIIKPGERIPLDGEVIEGQGRLDTSALTGESVPRRTQPGDEVLSGFINQDGLLTVKVKKVYSESTITKILDLVENASSKKAPTENFITKFAAYYTPIVVVLAVVIALIPPLVIDQATFSQWFYRALVFLVISCPCALVISIPLGFFGGIGSASRRGILIKGGNYLEALNDIDSVVFDKTGTLTQGVFKVSSINPSPSFTKAEVLKYAAYAETYSNHPIAQSIRQAYTEGNAHSMDKGNITGFQEIVGFGVKAQYLDKEILAGNKKLMIKAGIELPVDQEEGTIVYIAVQGKFAGAIIISDELKRDAIETIQGLKDRGIRNLVMLTGDRQEIGQKIAEKLGLDQVYGELLPDEKVKMLEKIIAEKTGRGAVIFAGDGINDAPVLARADVGVAMGGLGSDAAIEAADIVLMTDEPKKLPEAIDIAARTRKVVWQNIGFSVGVKIIVMILGAGGIATLWEAVFADVGVALLAVFNAMRLLK